jgi:hypothetical protein
VTIIFIVGISFVILVVLEDLCSNVIEDKFANLAVVIPAF